MCLYLCYTDNTCRGLIQTELEDGTYNTDLHKVHISYLTQPNIHVYGRGEQRSNAGPLGFRWVGHLCDDMGGCFSVLTDQLLCVTIYTS